jgi:hypothetical protein
MTRKFVLAAALALAGGSSAAQSTLAPDEARMTAAQLLARGQAQAAVDITDMLIRRDPEDATSLILNAHARRTLGDARNARRAARQGYQASDRPVERYGAAMAMAQALSSDGAKTRAQFWLRRAAHVAPDEQTRARAIRDYRYVSMTNPWSVDLSFSIDPSDNVNGAPSDNTFVLGGLIFTNPAAVPISGFVLRQNTSLRYNFDISQTRRSFAACPPGWMLPIMHFGASKQKSAGISPPGQRRRAKRSHLASAGSGPAKTLWPMNSKQTGARPMPGLRTASFHGTHSLAIHTARTMTVALV